MDTRKLKIAFLTGIDQPSTISCIEAVCRLPGVQPVGILFDTGRSTMSRRMKNLRGNVRSEGLFYVFHRLLAAVRGATDKIVWRTAVSHAEVEQLLRRAFPERCFSLEDVARKIGAPLREAGNLNGEMAIQLLKDCDADLGIVLGTRILKPGIFSVPRLGCINLHKGKVPDYRGMPPGFWELYDGAKTAGVTVHYVDKGLDTGDIVEASEIPVLKTDTPDSLLEKLHMEGDRVMVAAVAAIRDGTAARIPQVKSGIKPRTKPKRRDVEALRRRLPDWRLTGHLSSILKNLYILAVYYLGIYGAVRWFHKLSARSRAGIILYHRVNDYSKDVLTVDCEAFAAQLLTLSRRYPVMRTDAIVDRVRRREPIPPTALAIHFDDCYRDVLLNGAPILKALGLPACAFINSGYLDTTRTFAHDAIRYPFPFEMLTSEELAEWSRQGFETAAHTVNHVDLGKFLGEATRGEIVECGEALRRVTGQPVDMFSFPFGKLENICPPSKAMVAESGYNALFSAHGGFVGPNTDPFDIPRMGSSFESAPVYCLLQMEGLTPGQLADAIRPAAKPSRAAPVLHKPA